MRCKTGWGSWTFPVVTGPLPVVSLSIASPSYEFQISIEGVCCAHPDMLGAGTLFVPHLTHVTTPTLVAPRPRAPRAPRAPLTALPLRIEKFLWGTCAQLGSFRKARTTNHVSLFLPRVQEEHKTVPLLPERGPHFGYGDRRLYISSYY